MQIEFLIEDFFKSKDGGSVLVDGIGDKDYITRNIPLLEPKSDKQKKALETATKSSSSSQSIAKNMFALKSVLDIILANSLA